MKTISVVKNFCRSTTPLLFGAVSPPWNHRERGFDIEVTSPSSSRSSPSFCCRCIVCYSSATQINSPAPTPDSSFTQECSFCGSSSSGHAQFAPYTTVGEKLRLGSVITTAFSSPSVFPSPSLFLSVIWRECRGRRSFYLFTPNEMLCMDLKEDGHNWDSGGWQIF